MMIENNGTVKFDFCRPFSKKLCVFDLAKIDFDAHKSYIDKLVDGVGNSCNV